MTTFILTDNLKNAKLNYMIIILFALQNTCIYKYTPYFNANALRDKLELPYTVYSFKYREREDQSLIFLI
jgi:hypothetical protein